MHSFLDAKLMAKALRKALAERDVALSHSDCLELVAQQLGVADWNTLAARIAAAKGDDELTLPQDWLVMDNTERNNYRLGLDPQQPGTALIESRYARGKGVVLEDKHFGTLMQSILADDYRDLSVKITASVRTEDANAGSIWMRVDGAKGQVLRFDNMITRRKDGALKGTTDWTELQVVLEVPQEAESIHYGFLLLGHGRLWGRDFRIEATRDNVRSTSTNSYLKRPTNLGFAAGQGASS
jgi:hypothetical protein